jgi:hypothetical protein
MAKLRVQVITKTATALAPDFVVNTVYFDVFGIQGDPDYQAIANSTRDAFKARNTLPGGWGCETRVYDMADPLPRPIKATGAWQVTSAGAGLPNVREVALCLSYYSERNLPRFRGRLYVGPFVILTERPNATALDSVMALAVAIAAVGGANVDWQLYSPTRNAYSKITNVWADDEWDTVRSRGLRATTRRLALSGE